MVQEKQTSLRYISLLLAVVFGFESLAWPSPEPRPATAPKSFLTIPKALGTLTEGNFFAGLPSGRPLVIHLQDAHASPEAQEKIRDLLAEFTGKKSPLVVAFEGGTGTLYPEQLNQFPGFPKVNEEIVRHLTEEGILSGPELFAWEIYRSGTGAKVFFQGAENPRLYRNNLKAYRALSLHEGDIERALSAFKIALDSVGTKTFNPKLRKFLFETEKRRDGEFQTEIRSPNFSAYLTLLRDTALKELGIDLRDRIEQIRFPSLTRLLFLAEFGKTLDHRAQILLQSEIESRGLLEEMMILENQIRRRLARSAREVELLGIVDDLERVRKLLGLKLTGAEYETFLKREQEIAPESLGRRFSQFRAGGASLSSLKPAYEIALRFYRLARQRDWALLDHALQAAERVEKETGESPTVALIAGGFHTPGLAARMKEENIRFAVVSPRISAETLRDSRYRELMEGQWLSSGLPERDHLSLPKILMKTSDFRRLNRPEEKREILAAVLRDSGPYFRKHYPGLSPGKIEELVEVAVKRSLRISRSEIRSGRLLGDSPRAASRGPRRFREIMEEDPFLRQLLREHQLQQNPEQALKEHLQVRFYSDLPKALKNEKMVRLVIEFYAQWKKYIDPAIDPSILLSHLNMYWKNPPFPRGSHTAAIASYGDEPVGIYEIDFDKEEAWARGIYVKRHYQGRGVGGRLRDFALREFKARGFKTFEISVIDRTPEAQGLQRQFIRKHRRAVKNLIEGNGMIYKYGIDLEQYDPVPPVPGAKDRSEVRTEHPEPFKLETLVSGALPVAATIYEHLEKEDPKFLRRVPRAFLEVHLRLVHDMNVWSDLWNEKKRFGQVTENGGKKENRWISELFKRVTLFLLSDPRNHPFVFRVKDWYLGTMHSAEEKKTFLPILNSRYLVPTSAILILLRLPEIFQKIAEDRAKPSSSPKLDRISRDPNFDKAFSAAVRMVLAGWPGPETIDWLRKRNPPSRSEVRGEPEGKKLTEDEVLTKVLGELKATRGYEELAELLSLLETHFGAATVDQAIRFALEHEKELRLLGELIKKQGGDPRDKGLLSGLYEALKSEISTAPRRRLLVLDDRAKHRDRMLQRFREEYEVIDTAATLAEAKALIEKNPPYDLALLDMDLSHKVWTKLQEVPLDGVRVPIRRAGEFLALWLKKHSKAPREIIVHSTIFNRPNLFKKGGLDPILAYATGSDPWYIRSRLENEGIRVQGKEETLWRDGLPRSEFAARYAALEQLMARRNTFLRHNADGTIYVAGSLPGIVQAFEKLEGRLGSLRGKKLLDFGAGDLRVSLVAVSLFGMKVLAVEKYPVGPAGTTEEILKEAVREGLVGRRSIALALNQDALEVPWSDQDLIFFYYTESRDDLRKRGLGEKPELHQKLEEKMKTDTRPGTYLALVFNSDVQALVQGSLEGLDHLGFIAVTPPSGERYSLSLFKRPTRSEIRSVPNPLLVEDSGALLFRHSQQEKEWRERIFLASKNSVNLIGDLASFFKGSGNGSPSRISKFLTGNSPVRWKAPDGREVSAVIRFQAEGWLFPEETAFLLYPSFREFLAHPGLWKILLPHGVDLIPPLGSLGRVVLEEAIVSGEAVLFVEEIQPSRGFHHLPKPLKKRYGEWHRALLKRIAGAAYLAGYRKIYAHSETSILDSVLPLWMNEGKLFRSYIQPFRGWWKRVEIETGKATEDGRPPDLRETELRYLSLTEEEIARLEQIRPVINSRAEVRQFRWFRAAVTLGAGVLIAWLFYGFLEDYYFPFKNKYLQGDSPLLILAGLWPVSILGGLLGGALGELITKVLLKAKPTEKGPAETEGIKNKKHWEPILRILRQGFLLGGFFGAPIYGFMVWGWAIRIIPQVGPIPAEFLQALTSESVLAPFLFAPMNLMFSKLVIGWRWARFREVVQEARASLLSFFFLQFAIWVPGYTWGLQPSDTIERMARINAVGIFYQALLNVASHLKTIGFFSEFSRRLGFLYRVIKSPIGWLQGYYNKPWFGMFILTVGYGFYVTFIARVILWAGASRFLISAVVLGFGLFWFYAFVRSRNLLVPLPVGQGHEGDEGKGEKRDSFPGGKQAGSGDRRAEVRSSRFEIAPPLLKRLIQQYFGNVRRIAKRRRVSYQTVANWIREHHLVLFAREWRKKRPTKAELLYPGYERLRSALVRFRALRSMVAAAFTGASETLVDQWVEKRKGLRKLARRLQKEREETVGLYPGDARFERSLIRNHGLQQRVAKDFGVTQPTVLKWEREHRFRTLTKELRASRSQKTNHRAETRSRTFQTLPTGRPPSAETKRLLRRIRTNSGRRGPRPSPRSEARTEVRVVSAEELSRDPGAVAEAIYEIDRQTFSKAFRLTPAGILSILRDKRNRVFIAVEGDQEVGFSIHRFEDENSENAHLDRMAVLPRFRNQGIGSLILDTVIADVDRERGRELAFFPFRLSIGSDLPLTWYRSYVRKRASQGFELSPFQVPNSLGWKIRWNSKYSWATWELIRFFTGERGVRIRSELRAPIQGVEKSRLVQRGLNRLAGFLPPAKNIAEEFGLKVPEAEAAVADILIRHEGMAASEVRARSWLSRLGLPSSETVRERDEKIAFIYLEGAAFETGLLAAVPSLLEAYGENARAGVVTPDALHPVVQKIEAKLRAGQEIIEGEDLGQVIEQISAFKPGRMVVFTGPDDPYFPTGFLKQLLPDSGIEVEVKPVSQADLEWAKGSLPDLFDEIESLQREVRLIRQAA